MAGEKIQERTSRLFTQERNKQANNIDTLSEYSLRRGYGLQLRRRRSRKNKIII